MNSQDNIKYSVSRHLRALKGRAFVLAKMTKKSPDQCKHEYLLEVQANIERKAQGRYGKQYSGIASLGEIFDSCDRLALSINCGESNELIGQLIKLTRLITKSEMKLNATFKMAARVKVSQEQNVKQQEKKIVKECWIGWQNNPSQYKSNSAFANSMLKKFEPDNPADQNKHLNNVKVIADWCTAWKKEALRNGKQPGNKRRFVKVSDLAD